MRESAAYYLLATYYLREGSSELSQLYSVAALQNLCNDPHLADAAVRAGVPKELERLLRSPNENISHFSAGALSNIRNAPSPHQPSDSEPQSSSPTKKLRAVFRGAALGSPASKAVKAEKSGAKEKEACHV